MPAPNLLKHPRTLAPSHAPQHGITTMDPTWKWLTQTALAEVERTLKRVPADLRASAEQIPVTFEPHPSQAVLDDGFEPDLLGLFVGPACDESLQHAADVPSQIILFLENLWDFAEGDETIYREEVQTTYLHELGHYLGLDEQDLVDRGLE